jgi:hypothetical protein
MKKRKSSNSLVIDTNTYSVNDNNYYHEVYNKNKIILAGSLRADNNHIIRLQNKELGQTKTWNTFTISREGIIYQHYDPKYYSDFIDNEEIDKYSISIVLENMGAVYKNEQNILVNLIGEICSGDNIIKKSWNGLLFWDCYTNKQFDSTILLCKKLCTDFGIENKTIGFNNYHKDALKYEGILSRSNLSDEFTDLNPSFNFLKFKEEIEK